MHVESNVKATNMDFDFANITRTELFSFILVRSCCKHEGCRSETFRSYQEDDRVKLILFTGWVELLSFPRTYTNADHDGL